MEWLWSTLPPKYSSKFGIDWESFYQILLFSPGNKRWPRFASLCHGVWSENADTAGGTCGGLQGRLAGRKMECGLQ